MRKTTSVLALAALSAGFTLPAQAANLDMEWTDPDGFRDIEAGNVMTQNRFERHVMEALQSHFGQNAARHLPADQRLRVKVSDLDLAGYVEYFVPGYEQGLRIISDDLYFPRISFSWELLNEDAQVIGSGDEKLKDNSFRFFGSVISRDDSFFFEKRMIDEWFHDTFFDPARS